MSVTDPTLPRKLRVERRPGPVRVVVILVVLVLGGVGLGYGWGGFGMLGAAMTDASDGPSLATIAGIILGLLLTILGSIAWLGVVMKRTDIGMAYGFAATLLGGGAGLLLAASSYGFPQLAVAIAAALLALGVVFLLLGVVAAARRRGHASRDDETVRTGTLTTATVSDTGYDFFRESPRILTTVTFTFTDLQGTQRWVQKAMVIHQKDPIVEGQATRLWYDASAPGDSRRIVVELARDNPVRG